MKESLRHRLLVTAGATVVALALAAPAIHAQQTDSRWVAWLGCWQARELTADRAGEQLCIVPTSAFDGVEMATVRGGEVVARETVIANGERIARTKEGCTGWESARFSEDAHRVYFRSEYQCEGGTTRVSTGLLSFSSPAEWLDVQVVNVGDENAARVLSYRPVRPSTLLPAEIESALQGRDLAVSSARTALASAISVDEVIEASERVGPDAVMAWIAERGQPFALDGDALRRMSDANVSPDVVDMVVAVSYPDVFQVDRTTLENERRPQDRSAEDYAYPGYRDPYGRYVGWDPFYRFGLYSSSYYYSPYGVGTRYGWRYGYRPVIVVIDDDGFGNDSRRPGRVVRGRGYTRDPAGSSSGSASGSTSSVGRATTSGGSSAGSSGSSGSSTTRRAKARTGGGGG